MMRPLFSGYIMIIASFWEEFKLHHYPTPLAIENKSCTLGDNHGARIFPSPFDRARCL
jgi:hypothetical protein